jgi:hypothetical protein
VIASSFLAALSGSGDSEDLQLMESHTVVTPTFSAKDAPEEEPSASSHSGTDPIRTP